MIDKYDEAIEYLRKYPREIEYAWNEPNKHPAGCLFQYAEGPNSTMWCGCLTQIKQGTERAQTQELTKAIRADGRIPSSAAEITLDSLPVFAEWQRRLDIELGRA